jgi:hypothetical protein
MLTSGNLASDLTDSKKCMLAMKPTYTPFNEGVSQMRDGKIVSFAVSSSVAVVLAEDDNFNIFFRQRRAGRVLPDNTVVVDIPILSAYLGDL